MADKTVIQLHPALRDDIGNLVTRRPLPGPAIGTLDPFLFLNHHGPQLYPPGNQGLPFGPHPHRGFETVTFILDGELTHLDSGGHESTIYAGGVQWMTAGRGLVHAEISSDAFKRRGGPIEILQLWVNLPARLKMTRPAYAGLQAGDIPGYPAGEGARVHLISGGWNGHEGPIKPLLGITAMTVDLKARGRVRFDALSPQVFFYVARGRVRVGAREIAAFNLVELSQAGDAIEIEGIEESLFVVAHADPIGEPVVSYGPFVMNTAEEIRDAVRDYQSGRFGA